MQYLPAGPLGDSITAYVNPAVGPWFTFDTHSNIQNFLKGWTHPTPLGTNGLIVMNSLAIQLGMQITNTVIATRPSILNQNFIFVEHDNNQWQRQIFYSSFLESKVQPYVHYVNRVNNIHIEETANTCYKNVYYSTSNAPNTIQLKDACVLWANDMYSYVHILGASDVPHNKIKTPVFYRKVVAIPKNNPLTKVNISDPALNAQCFGDGVTTRLTFTCNDPPQLGSMPNSNSGSLQWDVTVYTTDDDLGDSVYFSTGGQFANPCNSPTGTARCPCLPNQTLLVVEATSLNNRRTLAWDELNLSVSSSLNSNSIELDTYLKFELICAHVYMAYTGVPPAIDFTPGLSCNVDNICNESFPINHTNTRESPQTMVLRLLTSLYGGSTYPVLNQNSNSGCCVRIN